VNDAELAEFVLGQIEGPYLGVLIYGSRVRGDYTEDSDIDVLQLNAEPGPNYNKGLMMVQVRAPWQLSLQCHDGDIYALSLIREGRILDDPDGHLAAALGAYLPPTDNYARKWSEFERRNHIFGGITREAFEENRPALVRATMYLLRNAAMLDYYYRYGEPCYSVRKLGEAMGRPDFAEIFAGRADESNLTWELMQRARSMIGELYAIAAREGIGPECRPPGSLGRVPEGALVPVRA